MSLHLPNVITRRWEEVVLHLNARGSPATEEGYLASIIIDAMVMMMATIRYHCVGARMRNIAKNMQSVETSSRSGYDTGEAMTTGYELTKPGSTRPEGGLRWRGAHRTVLDKIWGTEGWTESQSMPQAGSPVEELKHSRPETDSHRVVLNAQHSIITCPFATDDPDECRRLIKDLISSEIHCWVVRDGATSYFRNFCTEGMIKLFKIHSINADLKQRLIFRFTETDTGRRQPPGVMPRQNHGSHRCPPCQHRPATPSRLCSYETKTFRRCWVPPRVYRAHMAPAADQVQGRPRLR